MKNALLVICGMAFLFGGCQEVEKREVKKEERVETTTTPAKQETPEQK